MLHACRNAQNPHQLRPPPHECQLSQRSFHLHSGATALFTDGQLPEEEEDKEAGLLTFIFTVKPAVPLFSGSTSEPFLQFLRAHPRPNSSRGQPQTVRPLRTSSCGEFSTISLQSHTHVFCKKHCQRFSLQHPGYEPRAQRSCVKINTLNQLKNSISSTVATLHSRKGTVLEGGG